METRERVDVVIRLERAEPPAGEVVPPRGVSAAELHPVPFVGWLGLLRALAAVVDAATVSTERL